MKISWKLLLVFCVCITLPFNTRCQFDDEEDDSEDGLVEEGLVEEVPDEIIVKEKPMYKAPHVDGSPFMAETFDAKTDFKKKWTQSQAKKEGTDENIAKYDGKWAVEEPKENPLEGDLALVLKSKAKHHAISSKLSRPYAFEGKPFIVQYEVKFQNGIDCGGAYVKLLSQSNKLDLKKFQDKTPYTIMFGPDKCGLDHKLHFIMRHKNPKTGEFEEKHAKKPKGKLDSYFTDKKTHVYGLVINPDNTFEMLIDNKVINSGSLLEDMSPPINPPNMIDDPSDKKPSDWDEREKIPEPGAVKPEDWDESQLEEIEDEGAFKPESWLDDQELLIADPDADKPEDWDNEMDGEWEAPLIDNPECKDAPGCGEWKQPMIKNPLYKGKWSASMIDNPDYQGIWKPQRIENPDFFEDLKPYEMTPIEAVGLELWSMSDDIMFDNFLMTDERELAQSWTAQTWELKNTQELAAASGMSMVRGILDVTKDRPWLWAVFLVVIVLPIVLLIAYCCMPRSQQGVWATLMSAAEQRPWLWAIYCVVCLLPVVLLSICLCPRSGPIKQEVLDAARKKTDADSPDVEEEEQDEGKASDVGPGGDNSVKQKKSKAALEPEAEEEEEEVEAAEKEEADDEEEEEEPKPAKVKQSPRSSPRKRQTRKE